MYEALKGVINFISGFEKGWGEAVIDFQSFIKL